MLYVDYTFDLNDNLIVFDNELKLKGQTNSNGWGNLPEGWKEGDMWQLIIGANGQVSLVKMRPAEKIAV